MSSYATRLYQHSPVWMQNAMLSVYGVHLRRLRYGPVHAQTLRALQLSQWHDAGTVKQEQLARLNALLAHARGTVPFYRDAAWPSLPLARIEDLALLPVTRKAELQAAGRGLVSDSHAGQKLTEIHTGGTTGMPLTVYCDSPTVQRNYAFFSRFLSWAGIGAGARTATFAGRILMPPDVGAPFWRRNRAANTTLFSSYHISPSTLPAYVDALAELAPEMIDSYPSSIEPVARHLITTGDRRIRPRAVITSSETLTPAVRRVIEDAFGCAVYDHYGSAEMVALVTQCERGTYHVNPEFGVLELLRDGRPCLPGESGEVVATGFINSVMPLVRYAIGDWASWRDRPCECGRAMPALEEIGGRVDDVIVTPEGRLVGRLDPIFKSVSSLFECRIVQDAADHVRVEIVAGGHVPAEEQRTLMSALRDRIGSTMRIDVVRVDRIPRTARGKLRTVVNEWGRR